MPRLIAVDGPPGSGKTRTIVEKAAHWPAQTAVVTYTKDAAATLRSRAEGLDAGTIYSLSWPFVKPFAEGGGGSRHGSGTLSTQPYTRRKIQHSADPALTEYIRDAPSRKPATRWDALAEQLHAWSGGPPPFDLAEEKPKGALTFVLPLARWLEAGAPVPEHLQLKELAIDEAQDMSWVELRAAIALVRPDGLVTAYGDPGQAIYGAAKGMRGKTLPPLWVMSKEADRTVLDTGYRVGDPVASAAAGVLRSYYDRPASTFRAEHTTSLNVWEAHTRPMRGLVMGYSRGAVSKAFVSWGLHQTGVVPNVGKADSELVLSTGHAAKGAEADDVFLLPWSRVAMDRLNRKEPEALRLLYVMMTRARKRLHLPRSLLARLPR